MKLLSSLTGPLARKILLSGVALVLVVGLLGFFALPHFLRPFLEQKLSDALHRPVKVAELAINPYAMSATVKGFSVGQKEGAGELIAFDELYVNLEASSLIHLAPVVNQLRLTGPRLHLVRTPDKRYNVSDLIEEFLARPDSPPSRFALYNIQLSGGRILFEDGPKKRRHELTGLELGIPFISNLPSQVDVFVQTSLAAKLNGAAFSLAGQAKPFAQNREASLDVVLGDLDITPYLDYVPLALNFSLPSARLDTRLKLAFTQPEGRPAGLSLSGEIGLRKLLLKGKDGQPVLDLPAAKLRLKSLEPLLGKGEVESLSLESPRLQVVREKDGGISLPRLAAAEPPVLPTKAAAKPATADKPPEARPIAVPFSLKLASFQITDGALTVEDRMAAQPAGAKLLGLDVKLEGLALSGAELQGKAGLSLGFQSLTVQGQGEKQPAFSMGRLSAAGQADGEKRELALAELRAEDGRIFASRDKEGNLNLARLLPAGSGKTVPSAAGKSRPAAEKPGWTITLAKLVLAGWGARFEDMGIAGASPLVVDALALNAENLSTAPGAKPRLALKAALGKKGHVDVAGSLSLAPLAGKFDLDVKGLDLVPLQGYLDHGFNLTLNRGALDGKGSLSFEQPGSPRALKAGFKGSLGLMDLGLVEKGNASDLLKWKALRFSGVNAALGGEVPVDLALSEIALKDFFARLVINADGTLALRHLLKGESHALGESHEKAEQGEGAKALAAPASAAAPAAAAVTPPAPDKPAAYRIRVDKVALSGGRVRFSDLFIKPNYSANLTGLSGSVKGLSSVPGTMATVDIAGTVDEVAPLTIAGKVNPLAKNLFLDLTADAKGIEMSGFSPYAARYAGYGIEKGKLSANIHYFIENRQLKAENHLFLDQLTFGQKVDSPQATSLPVLLAVALLKNGRGEIDINLPISGSLDDPQFSIGGIVFKMFLNLIVKAVTSPFALIGSLFGGGEELAWLEFDAGRGAIPPAGVAKLEKLAKALKDRPGLKLEITGRADAAADTEGAKRAQLERKLKAQKLKETVKKGETSVSLDEIALDKDEWPKYLALVYKEESFKKPKNMIGFTKSLPSEEMEKLILANTEVSEDMLRRLAERRGKTAAEWLVKTGGVPSDRVFVLAPKLGAETAKAGEAPEKSDKPKASPSRADFSLK